MERRSLLKQLVATAAFLAVGSTPYLVSTVLTGNMVARSRYPERNMIRPPGALEDDAAFIAACIGCGLCGEVCPQKCILFHKADGGTQAYTPYINPEQKACILCDKCMEICPTESLTETPRTDINMGIAQIDRVACYPWVDRGVCGACVAICPLGSKGIDYEFANFYKPVVQDGCVGCGLCVEVCPHPSIPIWIVERGSGTKYFPIVE